MPKPANEASTGPEAFVSAASKAGASAAVATLWKLWLWLWAHETDEKAEVVVRHSRENLEDLGNMAKATAWVGVFSKKKPTVKKEAPVRAKRRRN